MCFKKRKPPAAEKKPVVTQVTRESELTPTGNVTYLTDGSTEREVEVRLAEAEIAKRAAEDAAQRERTAELAAQKEAHLAKVKAAQDAAAAKLDVQGAGTQTRNITETETDQTALKTADASKPIGTSSVSYQTIVQQSPSEASKEQEQLAAAELARSRQERARQKQSLLRKRLERTAEYGSGKRVLTGEERQLSGMREDAQITQATGKRMGSGRRSLIAGSRGGIGFYSRYS